MNKFKNKFIKNLKKTKGDNYQEKKFTISSIKLSKITRTNIYGDVTNINNIQHPPTVSVTFTSREETIDKEFRIDPFLFPPFDKNKEKMLGHLLSVTDTSWDNISEIIGKEVLFNKSDGDIKLKEHNKKDTANYNFLMNIQAEDLYSDNISDKFIDLVVTQVKDSHVKYAYVNSISLEDNLAKIKFETEHGAIFIQCLVLDPQKDIDENIHEILFANTVGPKQKIDYTFRKFCKDLVGYEPEESNHEKIIGEPVNIKYTMSGWKVKNSMENIKY